MFLNINFLQLFLFLFIHYYLSRSESIILSLQIRIWIIFQNLYLFRGSLWKMEFKKLKVISKDIKYVLFYSEGNHPSRSWTQVPNLISGQLAKPLRFLLSDTYFISAARKFHSQVYQHTLIVKVKHFYIII